MRPFLALPILLALASCGAPIPPESHGATDVRPRHSTPPTETAAPTHPSADPLYRTTTLSSITLRLVSFDSRTHRLHVADQPDGPGSRWPDSRSAAQSCSGLAAINGGFFTPQGAPLGLAIHDGSRSGSWNHASSLGSGCYLERNDSAPELVRRELVTPASPTIRSLLQSGPMLVENGRTVGGLHTGNPRPRSFLAWDGGSRWMIATTTPCPLADLASALTGTCPAGWPVRHALNLDGGRSTELWVSPSVAGGPAFHRPFFNKPVRNFLILKNR